MRRRDRAAGDALQRYPIEKKPAGINCTLILYP